MQGSDAGSPSIRHMKPGILEGWVVENPVCARAWNPVFGALGAQRVSV